MSEGYDLGPHPYPTWNGRGHVQAVGRILADGDWDPVLPGRLSPDKRPEASPLGLPVIVEQRTDEEAALLAPTTGTTVGGGTFARRASDRNVG